MGSFARQLSETAPTWRRSVAPVAEWVAQRYGILLANQQAKDRLYRRASPSGHRSEGRGNAFHVRTTSISRVEKVCEVCGADGVKNRYCKSCAVELSRENMAQVVLIRHVRPETQRIKARISKMISDHAGANTWWDPNSLPSWLTEECFVHRIQPLLAGKKVREIAEAIRVSQPYVPVADRP